MSDETGPTNVASLTLQAMDADLNGALEPVVARTELMLKALAGIKFESAEVMQEFLRQLSDFLLRLGRCVACPSGKYAGQPSSVGVKCHTDQRPMLQYQCWVGESRKQTFQSINGMRLPEFSTCAAPQGVRLSPRLRTKSHTAVQDM